MITTHAAVHTPTAAARLVGKSSTAPMRRYAYGPIAMSAGRSDQMTATPTTAASARWSARTPRVRCRMTRWNESKSTTSEATMTAIAPAHPVASITAAAATASAKDTPPRET